MKETFDYTQVPYGYYHCLHTQCPRAQECLRLYVALHASTEVVIFKVINPAFVCGKEDACRFFQSNRLSRFAMGITHLYDELPHNKAVEIKRILFAEFQRNTYYRIQHKQRYIRPAEQEFIREVFRREGIQQEPVFDEYIDKYDW